MAYGKVHRFFLRTVASQGVLSIPDAQAVLEKFNGEEELQSVLEIVRAINEEIRQYYQEIKIAKDEVTDEDCVVFLSLADDAATKAQNLFSATELEYFRVLIEQIMSTESRQITKINAMNLVSSMKSNFTKTDAQKVLNTWCRMHYFEKEQDNYALGLRAIHEFEGYFRQNMEHAVEECFLCKHIVFRGYNCPGCGKAIHTRCLKRYLEKVQKWPCCKLDFEQDQLERLNNEGSRLPPTQLLDTTPNTEENNTVAEPTQVQEASEIMDETQDIIPEISQRVTRKRKRQISPQTQTPATRSSTESILAVPTQDATSRNSSVDSTVEVPTEVTTTHRSTRKSSSEAPIQVTTTRRASKNGTIAAPKDDKTHRNKNISTLETPKQTEVTTTRRSTRKSSSEAPIQVTTRRSSAKSDSDTEGAPSKVATTRRNKNVNTVETPKQTEVTTTRRSTRKSSSEAPIQVTTRRSSAKSDSDTEGAPSKVATTRRNKNVSTIEASKDITEVSTTNRSTRSGAVTAPITRRSTRKSSIEAPIQATTTPRASKSGKQVLSNIVEEPVTEIQESFKNMEVEDVTQRVTRKRKQKQ